MQKQRFSMPCLFACVMLLAAVSPALGQAQQGDVFLVSSTEIITLHSTFCTELRANTGSVNLYAFGVEVHYDPAAVILDTGAPVGVPSSVTVNDLLLGDVDGNGAVDIVDALMTARYFVGYEPEVFLPAATDVDSSGSIDILDALMIAQYYIGILDRSPGRW